MKNQALFSSKDKSTKFKCCLLQFLFGALHTCDNLSMTMLEIWFSFPGDCVLLPGDCSTASLTYHFEVFLG